MKHKHYYELSEVYSDPYETNPLYLFECKECQSLYSIELYWFWFGPNKKTFYRIGNKALSAQNVKRK